MSGPVSVDDLIRATDEPDRPGLDVSDARTATVGRFPVRRALPRRGRRTVGAWCFADHMGPADVTPTSGLDIGPHPHMGLQTVTWLLEGEVLHRDSLGTEQLIVPGQLNLMTAGRGVAHSEEATGRYRGAVHGLQLWIAQPEETRHGLPEFAHHAQLPRLELGAAEAVVLVGEVANVVSPARHDTPLVGVDVAARAGRSELPLHAEWEYAVVVLSGELRVRGALLAPGQLGYLGAGTGELVLDVAEPARCVVLGGIPIDEPLLMWWNFVARTRDELAEAGAAWTTHEGRFGTVASSLPRIPAPAPYWG